MRISEIYAHYQIPPILQTHMFRVAAVGAFVIEHLKDKSDIDRQSILEAMLLHDMGNIVKFNFTNTRYDDEEVKRLSVIQDDFRERYGAHDDEATSAIAKEIGVTDKVYDMLPKRGYSSIDAALNSDDWDKKIYSYGDQVVSPRGVTTIDRRYDDLNMRYRGSSHELGNMTYTEQRRQWSHELAAQIQTRIDIDLSLLTNADLEPYFDELRNFEIRTNADKNSR